MTIAMADSPMTYLRSATADSHKSLARQLHEFATVATAALKFALPEDTQKYFMANTKPPNRLAPCGYYNRITHTSAQIFLSKATQSKLQLVLLALKAPLTRDQHVDFTAGHLQGKAQKFAGNHLYHGATTAAAKAPLVRSKSKSCTGVQRQHAETNESRRKARHQNLGLRARNLS